MQEQFTCLINADLVKLNRPQMLWAVLRQAFDFGTYRPLDPGEVFSEWEMRSPFDGNESCRRKGVVPLPLSNVLELSNQQEVSSVSGEVILSQRGDATSICPITGQPSLAPISVTRIAIGPSCDELSPCGERYGLTRFR